MSHFLSVHEAFSDVSAPLSVSVLEFNQNHNVRSKFYKNHNFRISLELSHFAVFLTVMRPKESIVKSCFK